MAVALRHRHRGATEGDARAGVGRRPSARWVWFGMADEESFFVSADEAEDDGRGRATGPGSSRGPASSKAPLDDSKQRPLGPLDSDDEPPGALDRTANETVEDSDAFVSGDDASGAVSARGGIAGPGGTGANGEASGTDGEFVSGADTDTGIDGLPRAPRRLKTNTQLGQVLLQEEDAMATPLSPGTMLNEAWELAMGGGGDDATRENLNHEHRILDEDDEPTPFTLFRDAIDEDNDEEEEDAGFASAGNDGANERVGPGQADDVALDMPNNDDSLVNDDSFADPALDISVEDTGHDADGAGTPQRSARPPASSHVAMGALSPPSPLVAPSERHSFRLSRHASLQSQASGSSQKSSTPTRGWGEGGHATPDTTRRMSKAEEVLKAATRHSSDDDVDELADSSDEEGAGPSMAPSSNLGTPQTLQSQRASIGSHGSFSPYGSEGDVPSPHGGGLLDSASRRQERRRLQKERYLQKLTKGFDRSGSDPETLKKRAEALRRNASSEPDRPLRHSWSVDTSGLADRGGDKWLVGDSPGGGRRQVRGFETTGERRGSSRLTARHSLQRESELTRASDPRRTKSGGITGEALGSPMGAAHGSPMGAMGSPGIPMGSPGMMPMPGFGGMMAGMMAPQMQQMQMQQMMMMQAQMQTQMRMYQTQMQAQMAGMSIQSPGQLDGQPQPVPPTSSLAAAAADQGVAEDRLRRVFHLVADNADDEVMDLIDTRAVDVDLVDQSGNTLLMASCAAGHKRLSRHLVKRFAGLNLQNLEGNTALHFALAMGHSELGDFLVAKGADDGVTNNYGLSPFEGLAPQNGGGGGQQRQNRY